jgi:nickel/cobalt transporter (NicO) family protein
MAAKFIFYTSVMVLAFATFASAHPLGNFSINQYSRLEIGKSEIRIRQVVDMAEIPTFQETPAIDTDKDGKLSQAELNNFAGTLTPNYLPNLTLRLDGQSIPLRETMTSISLRQGAGGLQTLEIKWDFTAAVAADATIKLIDFQSHCRSRGFRQHRVRQRNHRRTESVSRRIVILAPKREGREFLHYPRLSA